MRLILPALCTILLTAPAAFAQPVTTESKGSRRSTTDYGIDYNSNLILAGAPKSGHHYYYHSKRPSAEKFSLIPDFADSNAAGKLAAANTENTMDELAKANHWKKITRKEDKEYHNRFKSSPKKVPITHICRKGRASL